MYLDLNEINEFLLKFETDTKALKEELLRMIWFMRGGLSYSEALHLEREEREIINKIIEKNLEITKETKIPFF